MPNYVNFRDSNGVTRRLETNDWTNTTDNIRLVVETSNSQPGGSAEVISIKDGLVETQLLSIDSSGRITIKLIDESAAANPSATGGLIALIRGLWNSVTSIFTSIGTSSDASSATGSIQAKLRLLLTDTIGATSDTANPDASLMARLRLLAQAYRSQNIFTRFGTSSVDTISGSPAWLVSGVVWNKSSATRYLHIFNRTTNPTNGVTPLVSLPLTPNYAHYIDANTFGSQNGLFCSSGLAWGFSSTESTFTSATPSDVSVNLFWRSN